MSDIKVLYRQKEPICEFEFLDDESSAKINEEKFIKEDKVENNILDIEMEALSRRFVSASESHLFIVPFVISGIFGLIASIINVEIKKLIGKKRDKDCRERQ